MKTVWLLSLALFVLRSYADEVEGSGEEAPVVAAAEPDSNAHYPAFQGLLVRRAPFITQLSHTLTTGQYVHLFGKLTPTAKRLDIKLHAGGVETQYDVPLYISIRIPEGKFIFKTFADGTWTSSEEKALSNVIPGQNFDLRIRILADTFQIFVNRVDLGTFKRTEEISKINFFSARGHFQSIDLWRYTGQLHTSPYSTPSQLPEGKRIDISGLASDNFNVSLSTEFADIALSVVVDFEQGAVIRNTFEENIWGSEERDGELKAKKGEVIDLTIVSEVGQWVLLVNGAKFATYAHRLSHNEVKRITIQGGIELHGVYITPAVKA